MVTYNQDKRVQAKYRDSLQWAFQDKKNQDAGS